MSWASAQNFGSNLFEAGDGESGSADTFEWNGTVNGKLSVDAAYEGSYGIEVPAPEDGAPVVEVKSADFIEVSTDKAYELSVMLRSAGTEFSKPVHVGLAPFDNQDRPIISQMVNRLPDTETELVAEAIAGETTVRVKDAANWETGETMLIAFNADNSGKFADLPNRELSPLGITSVTQQGDEWEIQLERPLKVGYPAGTPVREHRAGGSYIYNPVLAKEIPLEWTRFEGRVGGVAMERSDSKFWPGTRYVKVVILGGRDPGQLLYVDNIEMREVLP